MPRSATSVAGLLKLAREFSSDFDDLELTCGSVTVRAKRRGQAPSAQPVTAPEKARKKPDMPVRWAVDSIKDTPPVFHFPESGT